MIDFANLWAIARAEMRLTRRLVRYWIFAALGCIVMGLAYGWNQLIHANFSYFSATIAGINPRFWAGGTAYYFAQVMLFGITFLAFEVRARDQRERVSEVLDSRPFGNLELLAGRALGILIPSWIPAFFMAGVVALIGFLTQSPVSLGSYLVMLFVLTLPMFVFALPLTFFVTLVVRSRIAAAVSMIALYVTCFVLSIFVLPATLSPLLDISGSTGENFQSDIAPSLVSTGMWVHQLGLILGAAGFLLLGAAIHPRRDNGNKALRLGFGALLVLCLVACFAYPAFERHRDLQQVEAWQERHSERAAEPGPDILRQDARVRLDPGAGIRVETALELRAPEGEPLDSLLFTLNPGLEVQTLLLEGREAAFTHEDGLLEIELSQTLTADSSLEAEIVAEGVLDERFAYLGTDLEMFRRPLSKASNSGLLGIVNMVNQSEYVVLPPGVAWLPRPGADVGRDDPANRLPERYRLSLGVDVPEGLLVAGPGLRRVTEGAEAGRAIHSFAPDAPLPAPAIVAGHFVSRSAEVEGTTFEILVDASHTDNLELFAPAADLLTENLGERLRDAREWGLEYPYGAFTMVEVPNRLRGYDGSWRRDSTLMPPGLLFMREASLPTARFKQRFEDESRWEEAEGGVEGEMVRHLERFFENDFSGGNVFIAFTRNLVHYPRPFEGEGAVALGYVLEDLSSEIVFEKDGYFSVELFDSGMNELIGKAITQLFVTNFRYSLAEVITDIATDRPEVWDSVLGLSLANIDPDVDAQRAHDALTLKGGAMSQYMQETLGQQTLGKLLGALRSLDARDAVTRDDLVVAASRIGLELEPVLASWLDQTDLPAFELGPPVFERIEDDESGTPRYQVAVPLLNSGRAEGLVQLKWVRFADNNREDGEGEVVAIPAGESREIGLVVDRAPTRAWISTFFSLNRGPLALSLPPIDEDAPLSEREPLNGALETDWMPREDNAVVVDDLDAGFETETAPPSGLLAFFRQGDGARNDEAELDNGLPAQSPIQGPGREWTRAANFSAHGRYRRTAALVAAGNGDAVARFRAELPEDGRYRLEIHMPSMRSFVGALSRSPLGTWTVNVEDSSGTEEVPFEAASSNEGWNEVNEFELAAGEVTLTVTNELEDGGRMLLADAIRWTPVERRKRGTE